MDGWMDAGQEPAAIPVHPSTAPASPGSSPSTSSQACCAQFYAAYINQGSVSEYKGIFRAGHYPGVDLELRQSRRDVMEKVSLAGGNSGSPEPNPSPKRRTASCRAAHRIWGTSHGKGPLKPQEPYREAALTPVTTDPLPGMPRSPLIHELHFFFCLFL